jgi:hypothetical protein
VRTPLGVARRMVATVASALVAVVAVAFVLDLPDGAAGPSGSGVALGLVAVGAAAGAGGVVWARRRPLPCGDVDALRAAFVTSVLLGAAFAETPALVGFVATFLVGAPWPALAGAVVAGLLLWLVAPSDREVARREAALVAAGCGTSLTAALQPPAEPPT